MQFGFFRCQKLADFRQHFDSGGFEQLNASQAVVAVVANFCIFILDLFLRPARPFNFFSEDFPLFGPCSSLGGISTKRLDTLILGLLLSGFFCVFVNRPASSFDDLFPPEVIFLGKPRYLPVCQVEPLREQFAGSIIEICLGSKFLQLFGKG